MQLDIFNDSRDVMLRNDVVTALAALDGGVARAAVVVLHAEFPDDDALPALSTLVGALEAPAPGRCAGHAEAAAQRRVIEMQLLPAALRVFGGRDATSWLARLWVELAGNTAALAFDPQHADDHAAALWLRAGRPADAAAAAATIASWRRIPLPLDWMIEARWRNDGVDVVWPLLAELAWLAPARAEALVLRLADSLLLRLHKAYSLAFEDDEAGAGVDHSFAWFPAWVLTEKPGLANRLAAAESGANRAPEQSFRLLVQLLGLEHQGRHAELMTTRKRLQGLQPWLYSAYMKSR